MVASALVCILAGCGANERGDPVAEARELAGPIPDGGNVSVYCTPLADDYTVQGCSVRLAAPGDAISRAAALEWWFRVGAAERADGGASFGSGLRTFSWTAPLILERDGDWLGWVCAGDEKHSVEERYAAMNVRGPGSADGYASLAAGHAAGCHVGLYP